ncbi:MAG TPA: endonuclease domain-containing protein [Flavobacteriaceae bacterium]
MKKDLLKLSGMHDGAVPEIFRNAARLRENMTKPETLLWEYLKNKPLGFKFRRQHPIGTYILDFYCHKKRISIEVDGSYHQRLEQKEKDKERTDYLQSIGIRELRFDNQEVLKHLQNVIQKIETELRADTTSGAGGGK